MFDNIFRQKNVQHIVRPTAGYGWSLRRGYMG